MQFGGHTTGTQRRAGTACQSQNILADLVYHRDEFGVGIGVRIGIVQAVDIRKQDQQIGTGIYRHNGTQRIVIANADLFGGDGVVFVNDRECAQFQQTEQGAMEVLATLIVAQIGARKQNLRHRVVIFREQFVVSIHQFALAHSGSRLLGGHIGGTRFKRQFAHAHTNGTRGYQDHFVARIF